MRDIVPRQDIENIRRMIFVTNEVILVWYSDYKLVYMKSDGTVHHQTESRVKSIRSIDAETEIVNNTKFLAVQDYNYN